MKILPWSANSHSARGRVLLFFVAFLVGILTKSNVNDFLTMGFDDYTLDRTRAIVDLNTLQKELIQSGGSFATGDNTLSQARGETCSENEVGI